MNKIPFRSLPGPIYSLMFSQGECGFLEKPNQKTTMRQGERGKNSTVAVQQSDKFDSAKRHSVILQTAITEQLAVASSR